MGTRGTLVIKCLKPYRNNRTLPAYAVTFVSPEEEPAASPYRCPSDYALLRLLEDLLPSPEQRLRTLEQVGDGQEVAVPNLEVPEALLVKYGFRLDGAQAHGRQAVARRCGVCSLPTTPTNRLTTLSGEVVHYECRAGAGEVLEAAARFLLSSPGRGFCHTCLAGIFHIGFDEVRKVVGQLRVRTDMSLQTAQCSTCNKHRITLSASAAAEA